MHDPLFLTWFSHRRTTAICERLQLPLVELVSPSKGARRYVALAFRTIELLMRKRPRVLLVQNPSLVLALFARLLRPFFGYKLVVDAHNEAVEPYLHQTRTIRRVTYWLLRKADLTIVTNRQLATVVEGHGGRALVLPDGIPVPPSIDASRRGGAFNVTLISTFAGDEPFDIVVEAMRRLGDGVRLHVTGNPAKLEPAVKAALPANITLTGFLAEEDYWRLLASGDAVMDLTTMDNCLVCGAYEAISVGCPLILSGSDASRELFTGFAVFSDNTVAGTVRAIEGLRAEHASFLASVPANRAAFEDKWWKQAEKLRAWIRAESSR